ncbi:hypothetical protein L1987_66969 [Smallanthus sonchifolius]|uniref:Uncharacterized protein n=1 Tax=Smallanthus sonchifolius TaxID=185202 RepID=A0ACB9BYM3_9ASTR|nr:hypothetical protein L1987_66969 [Smallanthus sonchifolius]
MVEEFAKKVWPKMSAEARKSKHPLPKTPELSKFPLCSLTKSSSSLRFLGSTEKKKKYFQFLPEQNLFSLLISSIPTPQH